MIFWGFFKLYGNFNSHSATPPYVPPHGRYVVGNIGHTRKWAKMGPKFTQNFQHLLNQCAWWVHILAHAPGDERHLYTLSIHGSMDFGPCVIVSTCGTCFWSTRKSHIFSQFCPCTNKGKIGRKQAIFGCSRKKSHRSILKHMVQNRYYHGLKAYIGAFHPPGRGPVCTPTRHTSSRNVENFG